MTIAITIALCLVLATMAILLFRMSSLIAKLQQSADLRNEGDMKRNEILSVQIKSMQYVNTMLSLAQAAYLGNNKEAN